MEALLFQEISIRSLEKRRAEAYLWGWVRNNPRDPAETQNLASLQSELIYNETTKKITGKKAAKSGTDPGVSAVFAYSGAGSFCAGRGHPGERCAHHGH
ncbi:hypothetical protein D9M69_649930 [compost metagenome]